MTNLIMVFGMYILTGFVYCLVITLIATAVLWMKFGIDKTYRAAMQVRYDLRDGKYGNAWLSNTLFWPYRYTRNQIEFYNIISELCENER